MIKYFGFLFLMFSILVHPVFGQDKEPWTLDRVFSGSFRQDYLGPLQWIENGASYTKLEWSNRISGAQDIIHYDTQTGAKKILVSAESLIPEGWSRPISIENYTFGPKEQQLLIFTNSKRVWRTNSRGDYWLLNLQTKELNLLGKDRPASSLLLT